MQNLRLFLFFFNFGNMRDGPSRMFLQASAPHAHAGTFPFLAPLGPFIFEIFNVNAIIHTDMKGLTIIIIIFLPLSVLAHGLELELRAEAGTVPGEAKYFFEKIGEWVEVNLLTLSTKKKQAKKLQFASERVAELGILANLQEPKDRDLRRTMARYKGQLVSAEDMAEKIIFLDGHEIGVAEKLEEETRLQEKFLREIKEQLSEGHIREVIDQSLKIAREINKRMFTFMVEKYQGSDADIRKHQAILGKHLALVRETLPAIQDQEKLKQVNDFLTEAEKFRKAGLNLEAYELIRQAKDSVY